MTTRKLHQIYLMVEDLDQSLSFYQDVLNLEMRDASEGRAKFETGECILVLEEDFDEVTLNEFDLTPPGNDRGNGVIIVVEVDNVESVHGIAVKAGSNVLLKPRTVDWGRKMFLITDPDGYVIEVSRPL